MKRLILITWVIAVCLSKQVNAQTYKWLRGGGTSQNLTSYLNEEAVYFMCTDPNGNVYSLSVIGNNAIYADTFYRSGAYGSPQNILLTSHNCNGQMRFAKLISADEAVPFGLVADDLGHIYVAADLPHMSSTLRIGYDTSITAYQYNTVTLIQYDTVGDLGWVRFVGENVLSTYTGMGGMSHLALDGFGNPHYVVLTEYGVPLTTSLTSYNGFYDVGYNVSGSLLGINRLDIDSSLLVTGVTIDKQSNKMYAYGARNTGMFPSSSFHCYLTALDATRNCIWHDTLLNPTYSGAIGMTGVVADGYGHLYLSVSANKSFIYKGDTAKNVIATGSQPVASIMKLDTAGNTGWIKTYSGNSGDNIFYEVALMPNNKIAASGMMNGKVVCGLDTMNSYTGEVWNAHFTIVDSAGYTQEFQQLHGVGSDDRAKVCVSDNVGNLYLGGKATTNIWGGSLTPYTSVGGDSDYFIMKYGVNCTCTSMPVANYTNTGTDLTRSFSYTGTSSGIDSVKWTFGDGGTSASMTPTHTYTSAGTYTTCVRVYSSCGNDMRCHEVTVSCATTPISAYIDTGEIVHGYSYTGTMTGYDSVVWDFGDGSFDTGLNVIHTYATSDTYHVCAKVYTNCGTHTWCKDVYVNVPGFVSGLSFSNVKVFPNPTTNELYITNVPQKGKYNLMNVVGISQMRGELHAGNTIISIQQMPPGIYLLEMIGSDDVKSVVRILKQ